MACICPVHMVRVTVTEGDSSHVCNKGAGLQLTGTYSARSVDGKHKNIYDVWHESVSGQFLPKHLVETLY